MEYATKTLKHNGIPVERIIGCTPRYGCLKDDPSPRLGANERGHQIEAWIQFNEAKYKIEAFAIIDDDSDMAHYRESGHFFKTNTSHGLQLETADKLIEWLKTGRRDHI